jgi:ribosomal protein S18 acetylase RimI-like enzyme
LEFEMTRFIQRPYAGPADWDRMAELVYAHPAEHLHAVDLPYRLASWSLDDSRNACFWEDADGNLLGWAVLQIPWATADMGQHPNAGLEIEMLRWGVARAQSWASEHKREFTLYQGVLEHQVETQNWLTHHGFTPTDWQTIHLTRPLAESVPAPQLPEGFTLRPLRGEAEVAGYVALHRAAFDTNNMTVEWRARTLRMTHYRPDLDVVAVAPDGRLAAFCVGWALPDQAEAQVEPLGVHPDFQHLGLGRAVLVESLRRMQTLGAGLAHVETYSVNDPARGLYESVGFRMTRAPLTYSKTFSSE